MIGAGSTRTRRHVHMFSCEEVNAKHSDSIHFIFQTEHIYLQDGIHTSEQIIMKFLTLSIVLTRKRRNGVNYQSHFQMALPAVM